MFSAIRHMSIVLIFFACISFLICIIKLLLGNKNQYRLLNFISMIHSFIKVKLITNSKWINEIEKCQNKQKNSNKIWYWDGQMVSNRILTIKKLAIERTKKICWKNFINWNALHRDNVEVILFNCRQNGNFGKKNVFSLWKTSQIWFNQMNKRKKIQFCIVISSINCIRINEFYVFQLMTARTLRLTLYVCHSNRHLIKYVKNVPFLVGWNEFCYGAKCINFVLSKCAFNLLFFIRRSFVNKNALITPFWAGLPVTKENTSTFRRFPSLTTSEQQIKDLVS